MDNFFLNNLAESLFNFLIIARNNIVNEDEFLKNFPLPTEEFKKYEEKYPMPPSHIKVIIYLSRMNSSSISKMASTLNISKSNMTPIIDKLVAYKLIDRYTDSADRRIVRVKLTSLAYEIFDHFKQYGISILSKRISSLSNEDLIELSYHINSLTKIFEKIKKT